MMSHIELFKPSKRYLLPNLSRTDFDRILERREVTLEPLLANKFYEKLEKNALYLDLVAKELAKRGPITAAEVVTIIGQISDNPENLFSLLNKIEGLKVLLAPIAAARLMCRKRRKPD